MRFFIVTFGVVVGGIVGSVFGWRLGTLGGRSDPENVWFLSMVIGGGVGLGVATALILRRDKETRWGHPVFLGVLCALIAVAACVLFVFLLRRP